MFSKIQLTVILMMASAVLMQNLRVDTASGSFLPGNFFSAQTMSQMTNVVTSSATPAPQQTVATPEVFGLPYLAFKKSAGSFNHKQVGNALCAA